MPNISSISWITWWTNPLSSKFWEKIEGAAIILKELFPDDINKEKAPLKIKDAQEKHKKMTLTICSDLWEKDTKVKQYFSKEIDRLMKEKWISIEELSIKSNIKQDILEKILSGEFVLHFNWYNWDIWTFLAHSLDTSFLEIHKNAKIWLWHDISSWESEMKSLWFTNKEYGEYLYKKKLMLMRELNIGNIVTRKEDEKIFWYIRDFNKFLKEVYSEEIESELKKLGNLKDFDYLKDERNLSLYIKTLEQKLGNLKDFDCSKDEKNFSLYIKTLVQKLEEKKDILLKLRFLKQISTDEKYTNIEKKEIIKWIMVGVGDKPAAFLNISKKNLKGNL